MVYLCVTLGVTDSLVLISLGIPLPRSVFQSCIYYYYSYIYNRWESHYPGVPETPIKSQSPVLVQWLRLPSVALTEDQDYLDALPPVQSPSTTINFCNQ